MNGHQRYLFSIIRFVRVLISKQGNLRKKIGQGNVRVTFFLPQSTKVIHPVHQLLDIFFPAQVFRRRILTDIIDDTGLTDKGLEFKNVFVVGLEENLFPSGMAGDSPRALEEERRLFYVAITRAEEHCYLSFAKTRFRYGKMEFGSPSRFLRDIDVHYLQLPHEAGVSRSVDEGAGRFRREIEGGFTRSASPSRASFGSSSSEQRARPKAQIIAPSVPRNLKKVSAVSGSSSAQSAASNAASVTGVRAGQMIEHERFGLGEVMKVEGTGDNAKATIHFKNAGDKQLLLRFARFKVIK